MKTKTIESKCLPPQSENHPPDLPVMDDQFLGEIPLKIVGTQYCDVSVRPGEVVHFEREYENHHDPNAICVNNDDFAPVGHLPRPEVRWIAPLLDSGRLIIDGRVPEGTEPGRYDTPLLLNLYLTPKGAGALKRFDCCATDAEALHEVILGAYERSLNWKSRGQIIGVARALAQSLGRDALPESFLLIRLLQVRARELAEKRRIASIEAIRESIRSLRVGKGNHFKGLTLFPLFGDNGHKPNYLLLSEALDLKRAVVTEISAEGSVSELKVENQGDQPILIPGGEIVSGGKQNRLFNITTMIEAFSEQQIPVSCVEQGRWGDRGEGFRATHFAAPSLRSAKTAGVHRSMLAGRGARSDQGEVWDHISSCLADVGTRSETDSFTESYERVSDHLESYRNELILEKGASGFLIASGNSVLGTEIFDAPTTLAALWPRLSESYFLEGVMQGGKANKALRRTANRFLEDLSIGTELEKGPGAWAGQLAVDTATHLGGGLQHQDRLCHIAAFNKGFQHRNSGWPQGETDFIEPEPGPVY